jgi:hypothetical protein
MTIDFDLLSVCGKPLTEAFAAEWFAGKVKGDWLQSKPLGVGARRDHLRRITSLHLFGPGAEKGTKPFAQPLPGGLAWTSSRAEARKTFGAPSASGEPQGEPGSIMYLPYPWDRWDSPTTGGVHLEYIEDGSALRMVTLSEPALPETTSVALDIFADYYQFYVQDAASTCDTGTIWDDPESTKRQIAVGDGLVAVGTKRYGTVPVSIEMYPMEPILEPRGIDRVNECGLTITTGLVVGNPISAELTSVPLAPGIYGVRVLYLYQKHVENDQTGNDRYIVQLWPVGELLPLRYIKPTPKVKKSIERNHA